MSTYPYCEQCGKMLKVALDNGWQPGQVTNLYIDGVKVASTGFLYIGSLCSGHEARTAIPQAFYDAFKEERGEA